MMQRTLRLFLSFSVLLFFQFNSAKAESVKSVVHPPFPALSTKGHESLPEPLREFQVGLSREQYLVNALMFIRRNSKGKNFITEKDIRELKEENIFEAKRDQIRAMIEYDKNLDGFITQDELNLAMQRERHRDESDLTFFDKNKDNVISYKEMSELKPKQIAHIKRKHQENSKYLALDSNNDNQISIDEITLLATNAFNALDMDKDGTLSKEEVKAFTETANDAPFPCVAPVVPRDVKLIGIGISEGASFSSVTASDQDTVTTATAVNVVEGIQPVYLLLTSVSPVIWQFTGNTNAIAGITVSNNAVNAFSPDNEGATSSGITGISKSKITFLNSRCIHTHYGEQDVVNGIKAKSSIKNLVGREPDLLAGTRQPAIISIQNKGVKFTSPEETAERPSPTPVMPGFDPRLWLQVLDFNPAGVTIIDPQEVVTNGLPAQRYQVLPSMAGIAKLSAEGSLEVLNSEQRRLMIIRGKHVSPKDPRMTYYSSFRIIKDIPRYPPGLIIGHVTFIIKEGVKIPEGSPGNSCVMLETGKIINESFGCD